MAESSAWAHIRALRPKHWTKNAVVAAAFLFGLGDPEQGVGLADGWMALAAAALFCLLSSGVYLLNDLHDAPEDRKHPHKRHRPIASGAVAPSHAFGMAIVCLVAAVGGGMTLRLELGYVMLAYVALQIVYTLLLKRLALIDLLIIATGFVLRAIAGAVVFPIHISPWLLVCTFLLALFLALCKRRQEKVVVVEGSGRASLGDYDERLLDQLISMIAAATLVSYTIYTLAPDTQAKFGTANLGFTIPFVVFGLFRYLDLVYRKDLGERPEEVLLTDAPLLMDLLLYGLVVLVVLIGR